MNNVLFGAPHIYDGQFHIFQAFRNDLFYHGSAELAGKFVSYPIGLTFSPTLSAIPAQTLNAEIANQRTAPEDKKQIISRLGNPEPAFFSTLGSALRYSGRNSRNDMNKKCKGKCIHAFALNQNVNIMVLNNVWNVCKIIQYISTNTDFRNLPKFTAIINHDRLTKTFTTGHYTQVHQKLNYIFKEFYVIEQDIFNQGLKLNVDFFNAIDKADEANHNYSYEGSHLFGRLSLQEWDVPLTMLFCLYFEQNENFHIKGVGNNWVFMGLRGCARSWMSNDHLHPSVAFDPNNPAHCGSHHPEVVFCNTLTVIDRLYSNPLDWQYNILRNDHTRYIKPYLDQLEKFKIINFNDYSGDIYETTIWTLLIYEQFSISSGKCRMHSIPVALLSHYLEPYSKSMETVANLVTGVNPANAAIIHQNPNTENYLLDMQRVTWRNVFHVIPTNLFNELNSFLQNHNNDTLIYIKIVTYVYLTFKDIINLRISQNLDFNFPQVDQNAMFEKIFGLMYMYNFNTTTKTLADLKRYAHCVIMDVFYLGLSAYIAKSSTLDFFDSINANIMNNDNDEVVDVRRKRSINISSRVFPFLSNISSIHRGFRYDQARIEALRTHLTTRTTQFDDNYITLIYNRLNAAKNRNNTFVAKLDTLNTQKLQMLYPNPDPPHLNIPVPVRVYNSAFAMREYVSKIVNSIMILCPNDITIDDVQGRTKRENIIYILKLLKPFFNIVFEEYSVKRYTGLLPTEIHLHELPRFNHNGLNHLRSVYFTAYVLETSNFIEQYGIDNNELFLILLSSYFVSIARFNETLLEPNINFTPNEFYTLFGIPPNPNSNYFYPYPFTCSHLQYLSSLILSDVFQVIKTKIPALGVVDRPGKFNIDNALHLSALRDAYMYAQPDTNAARQTRIVDFTSILTLGHYFDHIRPTTGYAQLDTLLQPPLPNTNNARGPAWLYNFIVKFYNPPGADWRTRKSFYYSRIYQTLQESGFRNYLTLDPINMNTQDGNRGYTGLFQNLVTFNFDAMSVDFYLAWKNIFASFFNQNYNLIPNTWITIPGSATQNLVNAP